MPLTPEAQYFHLGRLVEAMPDITERNDQTTEWVAKAVALIEECNDQLAADELKRNVDVLLTVSFLDDMRRPARKIHFIVRKLLAKAELYAPLSAQGTFIQAGSALDAFAAFRDIFSKAKTDLLIVDPYLDEKCVVDFLPLAPDGISIRLLADQAGHKPTLRPAVNAWIRQHGTTRSLQARLASARLLHDRLIFVDSVNVWTITQSFNAFAARSPATIVRIDTDTAPLKQAAYDAMWQAAAPL